jgi:hypothetical protein
VSKLCAVLGGAGLALCFWTPRVSAGASPPPPWANANYANRYVCNESAYVDSFDDHATGIAKVNPNGKGGYSGGILTSPGTPFFDPNTSVAAPSNFCQYTLDTTGSTYAINSHGIGTEVQSWTLTTGQNADCQASFVMATSFVLRNNVNSNNIVPRTELTTDNFLGATVPGVIVDEGGVSEVPGTGYCLK